MYCNCCRCSIAFVASAEERQLGTLTSQQLLPMAAWKLWAIKAGPALALALLLSILFPVFLNAVMPVPDDPLALRVHPGADDGPGRRAGPESLSLYVSSLFGSAVRAMVSPFQSR